MKMVNMSYCRFENTYRDLVDCQDNWDNLELEDRREREYRDNILDVCEELLRDYGEKQLSILIDNVREQRR
jgi:hypothetical protein